MAFLLLAALLGIGTLSGAAHAAPSVDTWTRPSPPRTGQPIIFEDVRRDALVIVDLGRQFPRLWRLPNAGERRWTNFEVQGPRLSRANSSSAWAYDSANDRLLIVAEWTDYPDSCCTDTTTINTFLMVQELTLGDTPILRTLPSTGERPLRVDYFSTALDRRRNRLIVVGGRYDESFEDEVFAFDLGANPHWSSFIPPGQPLHRRHGQAMVDSLTDRLYYVGGYDGYDHDGELRTLDLAGGGPWQLVAVADTLPRLRDSGSNQAAFDPVRRRILRFASEQREDLPDSLALWSFDVATSTWSRLPITGTLPRARTEASVAYDAGRDRLKLYGGGGGNGSDYDWRRYDLFEYAPATGWSLLEQTGEDRYIGVAPGVGLDRRPRRALVFGTGSREVMPIRIGFGPGRGHDWEVEPFNVDGNRPSAREFACTAWDSLGDRAILYGGRLSNTEVGDLWQWRDTQWPAPAWSRLVAEGDPPVPRWGAASVFDPVRRRLIVFGGIASAPLQDVWALTLAGTPRWTRLTVRGVPPSARFCASAVYDSRRDGMIVYGGNAGSEQSPAPLRDAWFLSFADGDAWMPLDTRGTPPLGRWMHAAMYDPVRDRMLVLWGRDATGARFDCAALELAAQPTWREYVPAGQSGQSRWGHAMVYDEVADRALILGGEVSTIYGNEGATNWLIEFAPGSPLPPPTGRPLALLGSTPNPTRGPLDTVFDLPTAQAVTARIYDAHGRLVRDLGTRTYGPGRHTFHWNGVGEDGYKPRPGVYFMRVSLGGSETTSKVVLLR